MTSNLRNFAVAVCLWGMTMSGHAVRAQGLAAALLEPHRVDLGGGRRLNFHCVGTGSPTVVFEQGGEGMVFNWGKVQPAVSAMTRTCFYDRGGFGWSDPPRYPVTAMSVTDDLNALLRAAGISDKIVLVGHSVGGFYATMYANRFPSQVVGLVLVDPGFTGQDVAPSISERAANRRGEGHLVRCAELARQGRLAPTTLAEYNCFALPADATGAEVRRYALNAITRPHWYEAEHSQSVNYFTGDEHLSVSHQQERDAARHFGNLPLLVLSRDRMESVPWRSEDENRAGFEAWRAGHAALAARSSQGRLIVVPKSGHFIQKDRPEAVIDAVREVLAAVRARRSREGSNVP
jgi:pimeloyl-ACP methyl ester carboxylesterase